MATSNYLKAVRDQYEAFPYPPRNPADEKVRLENSWHDFLELINFYCFNGRSNFSQDFRVLVAGGGTGDQTIFLAEQLRYNRRAGVVHLDISEKCNEIARRRAEVRKLANITWVHGSVLDLPSLKLGPFDYINCVGVLHHMDDPRAGLQALRSVLKDDGAMSLMLYGKYGRKIARRRAEVRKLANITWVHGSVLDLPSLKLGPFDYINCVGVLHHMDDPRAGLQALRSVLKDDDAVD